jgi:hypothetical protein
VETAQKVPRGLGTGDWEKSIFGENVFLPAWLLFHKFKNLFREHLLYFTVVYRGNINLIVIKLERLKLRITVKLS